MSKLPEIKLHRRRLVAENLRFELFFDHVEEANGREVENYLVVAPKAKTPELVTGVSMFPIWQGKVGLLFVYRHPLRAWCWEVPRGFIDENELPETAALRELQEETGLCCAPQDLLSYGLYAPEAGTMAARVHLFVATNCQATGQRLDDEFGHGELRFFELDEVGAMISRGEIQEPGTMLAYYRYTQK
jgi:ADP-ribose pyrophosphatase